VRGYCIHRVVRFQCRFLLVNVQYAFDLVPVETSFSQSLCGPAVVISNCAYEVGSSATFSWLQRNERMIRTTLFSLGCHSIWSSDADTMLTMSVISSSTHARIKRVKTCSLDL